MLRARVQLSRLAVRAFPGKFLSQPNSLAHRAYLVAISIKGLDGAFELLLGGIVAVLGAQRFSAWLISWSAPEIAGNPEGHMMRFVRHSADGLAHASTAFVIVYLLVHGVLKLGIAINLLRGKSWIYPVAVVVLTGFILFMCYRLTTHWSAWLFGFAGFDVITLALVINEWRSPRAA
jgi:uncharacterized membrane protein